MATTIASASVFASSVGRFNRGAHARVTIPTPSSSSSADSLLRRSGVGGNKNGALRRRRGVGVTVVAAGGVGTSFNNKRIKAKDDDDDEETLVSRRALLAGKALFTVGGKVFDNTHVHAHTIHVCWGRGARGGEYPVYTGEHYTRDALYPKQKKNKMIADIKS